MRDLIFEKHQYVGQITLNRPAHHNAYTMQMSAELGEALDECEWDDEVRVVLITGAGDSFCVGMDMSELAQRASADVQKPQFSRRTYPFEISKPVICAINGRAGGFGIAYPMVCDIRLIAEEATVAFSFVRNGLVPEMGATWILPKLIGPEKAARLLLTGQKLTGREALEMGLVSECLPREQLMARAFELANEIATGGSPACVAYTKRLIWNRLQSNAQLYDSIVNDRDHIFWAIRQADCEEGARAFIERRKPEWKVSSSTVLPQNSEIV